MGGPGRRADEIAVGDRPVDRDVGVGSAGEFDFRPTGWVGRAGPPFQHAGAGENLRAVANHGDRLVLREEVFDDFEHTRIKAQVFRRPAAGNDQRVVARRIDVDEAGVEREIVPALLRIGLLALEIMDRGRDAVACLLVGQTAWTLWPTASSAWNGTIVS